MLLNMGQNYIRSINKDSEFPLSIKPSYCVRRHDEVFLQNAPTTGNSSAGKTRFVLTPKGNPRHRQKCTEKLH
jgi:hypothetical protein